MNRRFNKVLVANRGEIAVRVIRAVHEAGLTSVAVFSDADASALHVREAHEAVHIGASVPGESYLLPDRIVEACKATGADAVHPGYGFLSENAAFARRLEAENIVFIGPPASAIEAMGEKTGARAIAGRAGVPIVPGTDGAIESGEDALRHARDIGFPVLLKAAAGGGGKGMRLVESDVGFVDAFDACRREALSAFGDGRVYLEKFIVRPRHTEIQVLADEHGNVVHLFERDCSIQRRHQKVIEEAPSPVLRPEVRAAMGAVAVELARAVGYVGAGTVEFLTDVDQNFYFLEMNTRLQVEHPVTELITGIDLVRAQLRIANGETLGFAQEDLAFRGAALQCRIYAEDPATFMPSPGPLAVLRAPDGPWVRDDTGYEEGDEVPVYYDPLLSKLVVWGEDRAHAIGRMKRALDHYVVLGIKTNVAFHRDVLDNEEFLSGVYTTGFIAAHPGLGETEEAPSSRTEMAAAIGLSTNTPSAPGSSGEEPPASPWRMLSRMRRLARS